MTQRKVPLDPQHITTQTVYTEHTILLVYVITIDTVQLNTNSTKDMGHYNNVSLGHGINRLTP